MRAVQLTTTAGLAAALIARNKRPTPSEERLIRSAIPILQEDVRRAETDFNDLDISLAILPPEAPRDGQLTEQLAQLSLRLSNARDALATHMDSIAYSRQVPVEVLEVIFHMCLPHTDYISPDALQAPLLLCQICSSWRRIALVTPGLWCSLSVHLRRRPGAWKEFLETWLGRSRKSPISLSIQGSRNTSYQYFNDHVAKMFLKHSTRWRRLRLDDIPPTSRTRMLNTYMPLLETLEISGGGMSMFSADTPRLRALYVLDAETDPLSVHVPYERLASFRAGTHMFKLDKCLTLLARCKNLTQCTIQLAPAGWAQTPQHLLPVNVPRLRDLVLVGAFGESDAATTFFSNIELPNLDSVVLINLRGSDYALGPHSSFVTLARKSNLRSLRLTGGKLRDNALFDTVVAIPSLKDVVLNTGARGAPKPLPPAVQEALDMRK